MFVLLDWSEIEGAKGLIRDGGSTEAPPLFRRSHDRTAGFLHNDQATCQPASFHASKELAEHSQVRLRCRESKSKLLEKTSAPLSQPWLICLCYRDLRLISGNPEAQLLVESGISTQSDL